MDEIKKENFDLKLRVSLLQERLSRSTPENIEGALSEVGEMKSLFIIGFYFQFLECRIKS